MILTGGFNDRSLGKLQNKSHTNRVPSSRLALCLYVVFCGLFCYAQATQVTVEIPDQFVQHLVPALGARSGRDASRSLLEESIAGAYRDCRLTMGQVHELLGFGTHLKVDAFLQQHEI